MILKYVTISLILAALSAIVAEIRRRKQLAIERRDEEKWDRMDGGQWRRLTEQIKRTKSS